MIFDVTISSVVYLVGKYVAPELAEDILWLIAAWQPAFVAIITGIAVEDAAAKSVGRG